MNKEVMFSKYCKLKEKYKVNNLVNEDTNIIFILESPHIDELIHEAPVSGLSGKAMSRIIIGEDEKTPLGIKLKRDCLDQSENKKMKIGIMNICSIPMQREAYKNEKVSEKYGEFNEEEYCEFFDYLEKLRISTKMKYKEPAKNQLQEIILEDFRFELKKLEGKNIILIPCGKTAEMFFEIADMKNDEWDIVKNTPHPSFGNWSKNKYQEKIIEIKKMVQ